MSKRQAPKQSIVEIKKTGGWGTTRYEHVLKCGHSEILPRASRAVRIACGWCVKAKEKNDELKFLSEDSPEILDFDEAMSQHEIDLAKAKASLAALLAIPLEAIQLNSSDIAGKLQIGSAYVFLSARDVRRLTDGWGKQ
jgi:HrpA-like RNA helicase